MNIKETLNHIKRDVVDAFQGIDSNPEHIASFPAHTVDCSRLMPLRVNRDIQSSQPNAMLGVMFTVGKTTASCLECGGSTVQ